MFARAGARMSELMAWECFCGHFYPRHGFNRLHWYQTVPLIQWFTSIPCNFQSILSHCKRHSHMFTGVFYTAGNAPLNVPIRCNLLGSIVTEFSFSRNRCVVNHFLSLLDQSLLLDSGILYLQDTLCCLNDISSFRTSLDCS